MSAIDEHPGNGKSTRTLSSASRALRVLEEIAEHRPAVRPPVLAADLGLSRAALHQHLVTLVAAGWVEQTEDGAYRLTLRASRIGRAALEQASIGERVLPVMRRLTARAREMSFLAVLDGDAAYIVERVEPDRRVRAHVDGDMRWDLHVSASGRVLVAFADPATIAELEARGVRLPSTRDTARVRREGYAVSAEPEPGEDPDGLLAVAVPLRDERGRCIAALGFVGPDTRLDVEQCAQLLLESGRSLDDLWLDGVESGATEVPA